MKSAQILYGEPNKAKRFTQKLQAEKVLEDGLYSFISGTFFLNLNEATDVFTIGHSTRAKEDFLALLSSNAVTCLVDIRTIPKSRHNPQFNEDALAQLLKEHGIKYVHMGELGGLRKPLKDSLNLGWRNESFRGYADYMQTEKFRENIDQLIQLVEKERSAGGNVAIMCAEAVPWRCHRSLVAGALTIRGFRIIHIISEKASKAHQLTSFAIVQGNEITYPKEKI